VAFGYSLHLADALERSRRVLGDLKHGFLLGWTVGPP
jgi:hypothetical protein